MKILRAFQVIYRDGAKIIATTYNEVDNDGNIVKENASDCFYAVNEEVTTNLNAIEGYIKKRLEGE